MKIFGVPLDNFSRAEVLKQVEAWLEGDTFKRIATVNPEFLLLAHHNSNFKQALLAADLRLADGVGINFPFWLAGERLIERFPGTDLLHEVLKLAEEKSYTVGLALHDHGLSTPLQILKTNTKKHETMLILVPDLLLLSTLALKLEVLFPGMITPLSSHLSPKHMTFAWERIRSGETPIILGTRQALFAPFASLNTIVVLFPEETLSYKQWDMTPYYETLEVAKELGRLFGATIRCLTTTLPLSALTKPGQKIWRRSKEHQEHSKLLLIDRRQDGKGARGRVLAKATEKHLLSLPPGAKVLLIAKERGVSGVLLCQKCQATARCPSCQHALAENQEGVLRCLNCRYESDIFPRCALCGHMHFKSFGMGTVRIEREFQKHFPEQRLLRIDRDSLQSASDRTRLVEHLHLGHYDWVIAPPDIGSLLSLVPLECIVFLEADHSLAFPNYSGEERLLTLTQRLQAKLTSKGSLLIETFAPEERVWQLLATGQEALLRQALLDEREAFGYPPVTAMIKISPLPGLRKLSPELFRGVYARCQKALSHEKDVVLSPIYTLREKWGTHPPSFLVKYPSGKALPSILVQWLKRESAHIKIDVHPFHLS